MTGNLRRGKFIVFEGIDGAGKATQTKLLLTYLQKRRQPVEKLAYPDKKGEVGKLIYKYLHLQYGLSSQTQFLLHLADFAKDREKIRSWLRKNKTVVADRYFTSALAYQGAQGFSFNKALLLAKTFELVSPDLVIFLKISPKTSLKRKHKEKKLLDRNEKDKKFLAKVAKFYEKMIKNQTFARWLLVEGEAPKKEVFAAIKKELKL
ncbi:MAG: dTMP kinase [Parcubacteria group bacterium Gr01-1014_30]|nr:MAG: dTMP kinase [Parcubacteria group bacterium Gr01-1014_30]